MKNKLTTSFTSTHNNPRVCLAFAADNATAITVIRFSLVMLIFVRENFSCLVVRPGFDKFLGPPLPVLRQPGPRLGRPAGRARSRAGGVGEAVRLGGEGGREVGSTGGVGGACERQGFGRHDLGSADGDPGAPGGGRLRDALRVELRPGDQWRTFVGANLGRGPPSNFANFLLPISLLQPILKKVRLVSQLGARTRLTSEAEQSTFWSPLGGALPPPLSPHSESQIPHFPGLDGGTA
jgi:hypothetical protein